MEERHVLNDIAPLLQYYFKMLKWGYYSVVQKLKSGCKVLNWGLKDLLEAQEYVASESLEEGV